jgi:hypothetical protein
MRCRNLIVACLVPGAVGVTGGAAAAAEGDPVIASCTAAEYRQFDFWVGTWDVRSDGVSIALSRIEPGRDGCTIDEHYAQADGYRGGSVNFYDAALRKWRQTWVDAAGTVGEFAGNFTENVMRFEGETHTRDGRRILRRLTLTPQSADRVRQYSEASTDEGRTWRPHYDFLYIRTAAAPRGP